MKVIKAQKRPYVRAVFAGQGGVGKTTAAVHWSRRGLWVDLDKRIPDDCIEKCNVLDGITDYATLKSALLSVKAEKVLGYDTIILDTITIAETMARDYSIVQDWKGDASNYADYSKGEKTTLPIHVGVILNILDQIALTHKCDIILICHSDIKPVKNPNGENYDKSILNLTNSIRNRVLQWADIVGFAWEDVKVKKVGMTNKADSSVRKISFSNNPNWDAKGPVSLEGEYVLDKDGITIQKVKSILKPVKKED